MNKKNIKYVIISVLILGILIGTYFLVKKLNSTDEELELFLKNYGVNEYIPVYVSDEDMARIYLNDFVNKMLYDTEESYNLLDEEYRNTKFGSYENYYNYLKNLGSYNITMDKFYKQNKSGYLIFGVYDNNGNIYIFKTKGVLQYSVYLDDTTVEIK